MENAAFDGYYTIIEKTDGHYLEIYAPVDQGKPVTIDEIKDELRNNGMMHVDMEKLQESMKNMDDKLVIKISDSYNVDEVTGKQNAYRIEVSDNWMEAYVTFYPGAENANISFNEILDELEQRSIKYGIKLDYLEEVLANHDFNVPYIIAQGQEATPAIPGKVEYLFKLNADMKPEVDANGNVNFHKLSVISLVKEGDLLARLIQTEPGQAGMNIKGHELIPAKGKNIRIRYGKNTRINEDKTELYADKSGLVKVIDEKIVVNNIYDIPGNVGSSTGDITFDGSVVVHGNVITGFRVEAKEDIEVMGVVEGATLLAGGMITLHSGIQGMGKSNIKCGGDLHTKFIEQADVSCGGNIYSEALLHSNVSCKGEIIVEGKKGMISGGRVRAGQLVSSRILGSHMGTVTEVEVGIDPALLEEYNELRRGIGKLKEEAENLEKVILLLNKRKEMTGELDDEKAEMYKSAVRNKVFLTNKITKNERRIEELQDEVGHRNSGLVKVSGNVYPGVRIGIGNVYYFVKEEVKYAAFYKDGADVRMRAL
jgi:uncharacterized protein (DUF342 family)